MSDTPTIDASTVKCDVMTSAADEEICLDDVKLAKELQAKIASATPYVVCPVGHLEIIPHKPVLVEWNFYSKNSLAPFDYGLSKSCSFKVDEPFGHDYYI